MSGIEEAALLSALVYGGLGAEGGVGAAAGAATAAGALGGAAAGAAVGTGVGAGVSALSAEELAMIQAYDAGGTAVAQGGGGVESLLGPGGGAEGLGSGAPNVTSSLLQPGSAESSLFGNIPEGQLPPSQLTDFEKFMRFGKQGLSTIGKNLAKTGMTSTIAKSLLDPGTPPKQESIMARQPGGGAPSQQPSSVSLLGQQAPHQVNAYAPLIAGAGGDDAEMQRRRKLMMQQMGYA
jgi:hypothetical protein